MVFDDIAALATLIVTVTGFTYWAVKAHEKYDTKQFEAMCKEFDAVQDRLDKIAEHMILVGQTNVDTAELKEQVKRLEDLAMGREIK